MRKTVNFTASLAVALGLHAPALAQSGLSLTVVTADGTEHALSLEDLDAMEQVEFSTTTIWTEGPSVFSGVPVIHILQTLDAEGTTLRMSALNDYSVEMPVADLTEDAPIVTTRIDGKTMAVRDKGPYWIMFPFDSDPGYRTEANYSRSVWQLKSLTLPD